MTRFETDSLCALSIFLILVYPVTGLLFLPEPTPEAITTYMLLFLLGATACKSIATIVIDMDYRSWETHKSYRFLFACFYGPILAILAGGSVTLSTNSVFLDIMAMPLACALSWVALWAWKFTQN